MPRGPVKTETKNVFIRSMAFRREKSRKKKEHKKARAQRQEERKALGPDVLFFFTTNLINQSFLGSSNQTCTNIR
jgi:hypothetical protein